MTIVEAIQSLQVPEIFSREKLNEVMAQALLGEAALYGAELTEIITVLRSLETDQLINEGKLTLGMIKPSLQEAMANLTSGNQEDGLLAEILLSQIKEPLRNVFSISLLLSHEEVEKWYSGGPKETQLQHPPMDENRYGLKHKSRWEEFQSLMTSGPVTFVLLYSEQGNAIPEWRDQMGNDWNIDRVRTKFPNSLRAKYGLDNHNNLLHGSDSIESVKREVSLVTEFLEGFTQE